MIISVSVVPRSGRILVKKDNGNLKVYLTQPAHDGQANAQLIKVLAEYLKVRKQNITILKGATSRNKLIRIDDVCVSASKK